MKRWVISGIFIFFSIGFLINFKNYQIKNKIFVIIFVILSIILIGYLFRKQNRTAVNSVQHSDPQPTQNCTLPDTKPTSDYSEYIDLGNIIIRADGKEISDEEIPYLMQVGYEMSVEKEESNTNPKFHRTEQEENLSLEFSQQYEKEISLLENKLLNDFSDALSTKDYQESILKLENTLEIFYKFKKFCYSKGKGGTIYFQDMWEYLSNTNTPCFSYDTEIKEALRERKKILYNVMPEIMDVISKNNGILQKNIYEYLPYYEKDYIRMVLRDLRAAGKVNAEKKGNTYVLTLNK